MTTPSSRSDEKVLPVTRYETNPIVIPDSDDWKDRFIAVYAQTGNLTESARIAGVTNLTVYKHIKKGEEFAERYQEARKLAAQFVMDKCVEYATVGMPRPVVKDGVVTGYTREPSPLILKMLAERLVPELAPPEQKINLQVSNLSDRVLDDRINRLVERVSSRQATIDVDAKAEDE